MTPGIRSNDVYYSYSTDGGVTWSKNLRVTDQTINRAYGVWANNFDVTPPIGVASTNELAVFGWDDTRNTDPTLVGRTEVGAGVQDIYAATVQHATIGGGASKAAKVVIAAMIGLVVVALILLLAAMAVRRSRVGPEREVPKTRPRSADRSGRRRCGLSASARGPSPCTHVVNDADWATQVLPWTTPFVGTPSRTLRRA